MWLCFMGVLQVCFAAFAFYQIDVIVPKNFDLVSLVNIITSFFK